MLVTAVDGDVPFVSERSELHDVSGGGAMFISRHPEKYFLGQLLKLEIFLAGTRDVRACVKTEASVVRIHDIEEDESAQSGAKTGIAVKFHQPFEFERQDPSFFSRKSDMKNSYRREYNTIGGKMLAALALMAIIPYLLLFYLYLTGNITISETILLYLPIILFSTFVGYYLIRKSADNVYHLSCETRLAENGERTDPIQGSRGSGAF